MRLEMRRPKLRWEDCVKRDLAGLVGVWRTRAGGGMETGCGDGSETGSVTKKKGKNIDDRYRCQPHPDFRGKEESHIVVYPSI